MWHVKKLSLNISNITLPEKLAMHMWNTIYAVGYNWKFLQRWGLILWLCGYNRYVDFKSIIRCQTVRLVNRSDLFEISNLIYNGRETVRSLYCSLQGQSVYGGCSDLAGSLFVKVYGSGNFWNNWSCELWQLLGILNLARKGSILVTVAH
jgi:hypothetical protein